MAQSLDDLNCGNCGARIVDHDSLGLKLCLYRMTTVKRELEEIRACDKCDLCEDHHE